MIKVLEGLYHFSTRQMAGMTAVCGSGREWEYTPVEAEMKAEGLDPIRYYIRRR